MTFTVGDKVYYLRTPQEVGTVLQVGGGQPGGWDMTEVFWPQHNHATWIQTMMLEKVEGEKK